MSSQRAAFLTPEEYLEIERKADFRSEYFRGETFAMAGASPAHALITMNVGGELRQRLKSSPCRVYPTDLRVLVAATGLYPYPDVVVVCGDPRFSDTQKDTLTNPCLIVEVLSESTKNYDRGEKFEQYRSVPSLLEYLTVAQDRPHVELYRRADEGWALVEYNDLGQSIELSSVGAILPLAEIYAKVEFDR